LATGYGPRGIPAGSQYLLELDYSALYNASLERQLYWVLAMKADCRAGKQDAKLSKRRGRSQRKMRAKLSTWKPKYYFSWEEAQLQQELGVSNFSRQQSLNSQTGVDCASNKRLWKPD
jgi:hypothetical protein